MVEDFDDDDGDRWEGLLTTRRGRGCSPLLGSSSSSGTSSFRERDGVVDGLEVSDESVLSREVSPTGVAPVLARSGGVSAVLVLGTGERRKKREGVSDELGRQRRGIDARKEGRITHSLQVVGPNETQRSSLRVRTSRHDAPTGRLGRSRRLSGGRSRSGRRRGSCSSGGGSTDGSRIDLLLLLRLGQLTVRLGCLRVSTSLLPLTGPADVLVLSVPVVVVVRSGGVVSRVSVVVVLVEGRSALLVKGGSGRCDLLRCDGDIERLSLSAVLPSLSVLLLDDVLALLLERLESVLGDRFPAGRSSVESRSLRAGREESHVRREGSSVGRSSDVGWVRVGVGLGLGDHERSRRDFLVVAGSAGVGGVGCGRFLSDGGETRRLGDGLLVDGSMRRVGDVGGGGVDSSVGEEGRVVSLGGLVIGEDVSRRDGGRSVRLGAVKLRRLELSRPVLIGGRCVLVVGVVRVVGLEGRERSVREEGRLLGLGRMVRVVVGRMTGGD